MADAIQVVGAFLKCDAPGCDHKEAVPDILPEYIGKPCPKCGASLCTQEDFESIKKLDAAWSVINEIIGPVDAPDSAFDLISFNPHGDTLTIKRVPGEHAKSEQPS